MFFSYPERERQSSSSAFNFITSSSIHIWKMLSSRIHPVPKLAYTQCAPHTISRPETVWNGKSRRFLPTALNKREEKNSSWYLCFEPWALCLLTPPKPEKGKKEWRKDCVWRLLCDQVTRLLLLRYRSSSSLWLNNFSSAERKDCATFYIICWVRLFAVAYDKSYDK